jgi:hypothetical protein
MNPKSVLNQVLNQAFPGRPASGKISPRSVVPFAPILRKKGLEKK